MAKRNIKDILTNRPNHDSRFIPDYKELDEVIKSLKKMGYRIILTQGVYDLIHEGHALYLEAARGFGDILVVGVDSDALTKIRKGPNRPIVPQAERIKMLVHLRAVDIVTLRDVKQGLGEFIKLVKPDVYIASKTTTDFTKNDLKKYSKICGKIITLPSQATTSTSARIRNLTIEGAEELAREVSQITEKFLNKIRKV